MHRKSMPAPPVDALGKAQVAVRIATSSHNRSTWRYFDFYVLLACVLMQLLFLSVVSGIKCDCTLCRPRNFCEVDDGICMVTIKRNLSAAADAPNRLEEVVSCVPGRLLFPPSTVPFICRTSKLQQLEIQRECCGDGDYCNKLLNISQIFHSIGANRTEKELSLYGEFPVVNRTQGNAAAAEYSLYELFGVGNRILAAILCTCLLALVVFLTFIIFTLRQLRKREHQIVHTTSTSAARNADSSTNDSRHQDRDAEMVHLIASSTAAGSSEAGGSETTSSANTRTTNATAGSADRHRHRHRLHATTTRSSPAAIVSDDDDDDNDVDDDDHHGEVPNTNADIERGSRQQQQQLQQNFQLDATSGSGSGLPILYQRTIARQIKMQKSLGKGRFGEVFLGLWSGEHVAVKVFCSRDVANWQCETAMFQRYFLRHENLVSFIASDTKDNGCELQHWLIMEYYPFCLYDFLAKTCLDVERCLRMCSSIIRGLAFLHTPINNSQRGKPAIAHMDVKSKNVLIKTNGDCVVADLGLSVVCYQSPWYMPTTAEVSNTWSTTATASSAAGASDQFICRVAQPYLLYNSSNNTSNTQLSFNQFIGSGGSGSSGATATTTASFNIATNNNMPTTTAVNNNNNNSLNSMPSPTMKKEKNNNLSSFMQQQQQQKNQPPPPPVRFETPAAAAAIQLRDRNVSGFSAGSDSAATCTTMLSSFAANLPAMTTEQQNINIYSNPLPSTTSALASQSSSSQQQQPCYRGGTNRYAAPEILDGSLQAEQFESYTAADMYSFALVVWEIATRTYCPEAEVDDYELPYQQQLNNNNGGGGSNPSAEDMREIVCTQHLRPTLRSRWLTPVPAGGVGGGGGGGVGVGNTSRMSKLTKLMTECWNAVPHARMPALLARKTLAQLISDTNGRFMEKMKPTQLTAAQLAEAGLLAFPDATAMYSNGNYNYDAGSEQQQREHPTPPAETARTTTSFTVAVEQHSPPRRRNSSSQGGVVAATPTQNRVSPTNSSTTPFNVYVNDDDDDNDSRIKLQPPGTDHFVVVLDKLNAMNAVVGLENRSGAIHDYETSISLINDPHHNKFFDAKLPAVLADD